MINEMISKAIRKVKHDIFMEENRRFPTLAIYIEYDLWKDLMTEIYRNGPNIPAEEEIRQSGGQTFMGHKLYKVVDAPDHGIKIFEYHERMEL